MITLFKNQTTNATSREFLLGGFFNQLDSSFWTVICSGTFDGATVKLEVRGPEGGWVEFDDATFTEPGAVVTPLSARAFVRAVLSDADTNTAVTLEVG